MANSVIGENGELLKYCHLITNETTRATWTHSYGNEIGRLAQGMPGQNTGTNTIFFIKKNQVPHDRAKDVTYGLITTLIRTEKIDEIDEPNRTRLVAGGDRVHYPGDAGTPTADLLTVKLLLNSIISTPNAKFMTMDIKDFYLNTPMARYEYMRLRLADMPKDVTAHYKLDEIATPEGYIYCEIQKGKYGLPHAGIIAQLLLEERLEQDGYRQSKITPGLWTHDTRPISFSLVIDDFGVKYVGEENAQHLLDSAKILQMLMRLERGAILRTHYQMGLRRTKSSPLHAWVCPQSTHTLPTPSPGKTTGSTLPPRQTKLWSKKAILTRERRLTSAQQGGEKIHPRGVWSFPVPCKSG
jgi:hypothetical protein